MGLLDIKDGGDYKAEGVNVPVEQLLALQRIELLLKQIETNTRKV